MLTTLRQLFLFLLSQRYALHNTEVKWAAQSHTVSERSQEASRKRNLKCRPASLTYPRPLQRMPESRVTSKAGSELGGTQGGKQS